MKKMKKCICRRSGWPEVKRRRPKGLKEVGSTFGCREMDEMVQSLFLFFGGKDLCG
jgi:hypothetical protein